MIYPDSWRGRRGSGAGFTAPASPTVPGAVKPAGGLAVSADGTLSVKTGAGLTLDANKNIVVDPAGIDVTKLNKADSLVSGVYQGGLNGSSSFATLANAQKGNWWNVSAAVTIGGTAFTVGDQLWCSANVAGTPTNLNNFVRVPATMAQATTAVAGVVQLAGDLAGSATAPSVKKIDGVSLPSAAPTAGQFLRATSGTATEWGSPTVAVADGVSIEGGNDITRPAGATMFTIPGHQDIQVGMTITGPGFAAGTKVTKYTQATREVEFSPALVSQLGAMSPISYQMIGSDGYISRQDKTKLDTVAYNAAQVSSMTGRSQTSDGTSGVSASAARADHTHRTEYKQSNAYSSGQIAWLGNMPVVANGAINGNTAFAWGDTGATWRPLIASYFTWKGVYASGVAYAQNDVVVHSSAQQSPLMVVTAAHTATGTLLATTRAVGAANSGTTTPLVHSSASNWGEWMMVGANGSRQGVAGIVPAPNAGLVDRFLRSDGAWAPSMSPLTSASKARITFK